MIFKKKYLIIISLFMLGIIMYSKNLEIIRFNKINLKNNVNIDESLFFRFIEYNSDSIAFYNKKEMHDIYSKIESLDKIGIINDLKISYSLPNQVFVYIDENKPIFMIKTDINQFIIDDKGRGLNDGDTNKVTEKDNTYSSDASSTLGSKNTHISQVRKKYKKMSTMV